MFKTPLGKAGSWVFVPLEGHAKTQLLVVMVAWPLVLNVIQFWVQDNFLKAKEDKSGGPEEAKEVIVVVSPKT